MDILNNYSGFCMVYMENLRRPFQVISLALPGERKVRGRRKNPASFQGDSGEEGTIVNLILKIS